MPEPENAAETATSSLCAEYIATCREHKLSPEPFLVEHLSRACVVVDGASGSSCNPRYYDEMSPLRQRRQLLWASSAPPPILRLVGNALDKTTCTALSNVLATDSFFRSVVLTDSFLGDDGVAQLSRAIRSNTNITFLDLRCNNIQRDGARALAAYLRASSTIQTLLLEWNSIGLWDEALKDLGDALATNNSLVELDLRNNKIGPHGICHFAAGVSGNRSLRRLDLRWNNIGWVGGRALVDIFNSNTTIIELQVIGNDLSEPMTTMIRVALERNAKYDAKLLADTASAADAAQLRASHAADIAALRAEIVALRADAKAAAITAAKTLADARASAAEANERASAAEARATDLEARFARELESARAALARAGRELEARVSALTSDNEMLRERAERAEQQCADLEALISRLKRDKADAESARDRALAALASAKDDALLNSSANERRIAEAVAAAERSAASALESLRASLMSRIDELNRIIKARDAELSDVKSIYEAKVRAAEIRADEACAKLESAVREAQADLLRELTALKASRDQMRKECERMTEAAQESAREMDSLNARWATDRKTMGDKLAAQTETIAALRREVAESRDAVRAATERGLEERERLARECERLGSENAELARVVERLKRDLGEIEEAERRRLREESSRLKNLESAFTSYVRSTNAAERSYASPRRPEQ